MSWWRQPKLHLVVSGICGEHGRVKELPVHRPPSFMLLVRHEMLCMCLHGVTMLLQLQPRSVGIMYRFMSVHG